MALRPGPVRAPWCPSICLYLPREIVLGRGLFCSLPADPCAAATREMNTPEVPERVSFLHPQLAYYIYLES